MPITPDAKMYDYQTGVATKLVPMSDGSGSYAPAVLAFQPLAPAEYDYIEMGYTGSNMTSVVYKTGGSGGTTVATLTLAYDGSNNLTSVTRS
jgi:hypothetical protein